jgi:hypothetical protein
MSTVQERSTIDPAICHGRPTIRGMRYPVETILELLAIRSANRVPEIRGARRRLGPPPRAARNPCAGAAI